MQKKIKNYHYTHTTNFDFKKLCELLANEHYDLALEQVKILAKEIKINNLFFDKNSYTRNIIVDNSDCWLGLLCWDKGAITSIHGHPEHAFFYVMEGVLNCKNFDKDPLIERQSDALSDGEYSYNKGVKGSMDNYIHQMNAKQKSISLHYYSDNPAKGEVFDL